MPNLVKKYKLFMNLWVKSVIHSLNCENNNILAAILDFSIFSNVFMEISFHYWIKHTLIHLHAKFGEEIYTIYEVMRKKDKSYPEIGQFWGYRRCATNIKEWGRGVKNYPIDLISWLWYQTQAWMNWFNEQRDLRKSPKNETP